MATKSKTPKARRASKAPIGGPLAGNLDGIREAQEEWAKRLVGRPSTTAARALTSAISPDPDLNLVGVGIGEKLVDGRRTGIMAVKFLVRSKFNANRIAEKHMLPKSIDGLPVDVEEVGLFRPLFAPAIDPLTRMRPAQPGCSVGCDDPHGRMAGTFGALVKDGNGLYILSNNHVLAAEGQLAKGSPVFQPGLLNDAGAGQIGQLSNSISFVPGLANDFDCAVAGVTNPADVSNAILQIGVPQGVGPAKFDMVVHKYGIAPPNYTVGQIASVNTHVTLPFETGSYTFGGQILISSLDGGLFADQGDSGALILERGTNVAVGLLFARSDNYAVANHLGGVLDALKVTLA